MGKKKILKGVIGTILGALLAAIIRTVLLHCGFMLGGIPTMLLYLACGGAVSFLSSLLSPHSLGYYIKKVKELDKMLEDGKITQKEYDKRLEKLRAENK